MDKFKLRKQSFAFEQKPFFWLRSAINLRDAAEVIFSAEKTKEHAYIIAHDRAIKIAHLQMAQTKKTAAVDIEAEEPNYVPGELLYAFAFENVIKGIHLANGASKSNPNILDNKLRNHKLSKLAEEAKISLYTGEIDLLDLLSDIAIWCGRYPVAVRFEEYDRVRPMGIMPAALLDFGSRHPLLRGLFNRLAGDLEAKAKQAPARFGVVVVDPPPGTDL